MGVDEVSLQPPGMPPGSDRPSSGSRGSADEEARILNLLVREGGTAERRQLYRWSGMRASRFSGLLDEMVAAGLLEVKSQGSEVLVVLRQA